MADLTAETPLSQKPNRSLWQVLKTAAQAFTTSWVDVATVINTGGAGSLMLKFDYTANDTVNAQFRLNGELTETGAENLVIPTYTPSAGKVEFQPLVYEEAGDADVKYVIEIPLSRGLDWVVLQIYAAVPGASAGTIANVKYRLVE